MAIQTSPEFKLATIRGPHGKFQIAAAGARPEGLCFLYQDAGSRFFFYVRHDLEPIWRVTVEATSTESWSGPPIRASVEEEARLRENIAFFFKTRVYAIPEMAAKPGDAPRSVDFEWRIAA
jgi:hypothetical protein